MGWQLLVTCSVAKLDNMTSAVNWLLVPVEEDDPHLNTVSTCMTLCDIKCDNYVRLVAVDIAWEEESPVARLKVFRGTELVLTESLPGLPSALTSFYIDESEPKTPIIAVAIEECILFYRNLKPYFKYTLPGQLILDIEQEVWRKLPLVRVDQQAALIETLTNIEHSKLTQKSQRLLQLSPDRRNDFITEYGESELTRHSHVVAMCCLQRVSSDADPPSYLVVATDAGDILVLEPQSFSVLYEARTAGYETAPSLLAVHGTFETDFRIVIGTRYGAVYLLRKAAAEGQEVLKLAHPITGLVLLPIDQTIVICSLEQRLVCYSKKGKQLYSAPLEATPVCMTSIMLEHMGITLICVAMEGGLVQFYLQKHLVDEFRMETTISALVFGRMGLEDHVLTLITAEGKMFVKILRRLASFDTQQLVASKQGMERIHTDNSILDKPKKSSIFIEQAAREKENAKATYGSFQVELWRLRHTAARATVDAINSSESTISGDITHAPVKLSAEVCGAGPEFRVYLTIQNLSTYKMASNLTILLHADRRHYTITKSLAKLPSILPGIPLKIDFEVIAMLDPNDKLPPHTLTPENSHVRVMLLKAQQAKPLIAAVIAMPQSEASF